MVKWCFEVAKGMIYLDDKGVIHRDLAARQICNIFQAYSRFACLTEANENARQELTQTFFFISGKREKSLSPIPILRRITLSLFSFKNPIVCLNGYINGMYIKGLIKRHVILDGTAYKA